MSRPRLELKVLLVLAVCGAALGCGSDDKKDIAKFVGIWKIDAGMLTPTCPPLPLPAQAIPAGEQMIFTPGIDSDLLAELSGCKIKFDVSGDVATAKDGQSCAATIPNPVQAGAAPVAVTLGVTKATFTAKGTMGTLEQSGTATIAIPLLSGCTYGINATATKMP